MPNSILFSSTSSIGRRSFSTTDMTLLSEKPVATTTTSDDVDEYQYVTIDEKPPQEANDRAMDDEDDSGDDEDYDSWDEDEDEDDSSDSPDTEEW